MKRGFLNSSKAKASPLGAGKGSFHDRSKVIPLKPRIGKVEKVDIPKGHETELVWKERDARSRSDPDGMTITTLPQDIGDNTECIFFPGSKEVLTMLPGFPRPVQQPKRRAHRVGEAPGKGLGLFATRALVQGELILDERPILVMGRGIPVSCPETFTRDQILQHSLNELERWVEVAVSRMKPERRAQFMSMANSHKEDGSGPLVGRVRTNGICLAGLRPGVTGPEAQYSAVCNDISRLNHSCSANTAPSFDKYSLSYHLYAVRDIAKGEELTFQYIDVLQDAATRREELKPYDMVCTCAACTDPESDARRKAIVDFTPTSMMWAVNHSLPDDWLIEKCREQIELIEREGLEHVLAYSKATRAIMEAYIALGDTRRASEWAAKAKKQIWLMMADGMAADSFDALLDPASQAYQAHPMWRARAGEAPEGSTASMFQRLAAMAEQTGGTMEMTGSGATVMLPVRSGTEMPSFP